MQSSMVMNGVICRSTQFFGFFHGFVDTFNKMHLPRNFETYCLRLRIRVYFNFWLDRLKSAAENWVMTSKFPDMLHQYQSYQNHLLCSLVRWFMTYEITLVLLAKYVDERDLGILSILIHLNYLLKNTIFLLDVPFILFLRKVWPFCAKLHKKVVWWMH